MTISQLRNYIREEFDKKFDLDDYGDSHAVQEKVAVFISSVITRTLEAQKEVLKGKVDSLKKTETWTAQAMQIVSQENIAYNQALEKVLALLEEPIS